MELLYLWIKEYYVIKNCGFQFSNRILVNEVRDHKTGRVTINVRLNTAYIPNFFPGNIAAISAIVGENGAGKSTLMDLVARLNHHPESIGTKWGAVYFNVETKKFFLRGPLTEPGNNQNVAFNFGDLIREHESELSEPFVAKDDADDDYNPRIVSIFYNPSLDLKSYGESFNNLNLGVIDVSTNFLILLDKENDYEKTFDQVELHRYKNTYRQFALSQSNLIKFGNFEIPKSIEIRFNKTSKVETSDLGTFAHEVYDHLVKIGREDFDRTHRLLEEAQKSKVWENIQRAKLEKVKLWFVRNLIDNFFDNLAEEKDLHDELFMLKADEIAANTFFKQAEIFFKRQLYVPKSKFDIWAFVTKVFELIDTHALLDNEIVDNDAFFEIPVANALIVHELHLRYKSAFEEKVLNDFLNDGDRGFLDLNWRDLSNGEKAYFDLFSRIFDGYRKLETKLEKIPTLYILIDEGEIGFHPQWQKEYIRRLCDFVNELAQGLPVQIILTSHSPFVLSDLPKSNVILLKKNEESDTVVATLSRKEETFAANIHELFTDTFFIRNGAIGDFAKRKVEEIIALLQRKDLTDDQIFRVRNLIKIIAEPMIKDRLTDLFNERYGKEETIDDKISRLQEELRVTQELKNRKKD